MNPKKRIAIITEVGIFSGLSVLLYYMRFPLPFLFPSFLQIQFSALPVVIAGFALGPKLGAIVLIIKTIICIPFTTTMGVGDLADFLINLAYLLITSILYLKNKTKKVAAKSLFYGSIGWIIVSALANYFILVPFYIELFMKGDVDVFVSACRIVPLLTKDNYRIMYVLFAAIPFNMIISAVVSIVTFIVYKRISQILDRFEEEK